jgi:hypothetical protein
MTTLFAQAVQEAEKLSDTAQNELAQQILNDVVSELRWQQTLSTSEPRIGVLEAMAEAALKESDEGKTFKVGFDEL